MGYTKMSLKVTEQERKRVKTTALVFCIIFIVSAALAGLFFGIMPKTKQIKSIGANNEEIRSIVTSHDGQTYFIQSANWLCEYDTLTDKPIFELNLTDAIKQTLANNGDEVVRNSLSQIQVSAFWGEEGNNCYVVRDSNGNIFKLKRNEQGNLYVCDDYDLIEYKVKTDKNGNPVLDENGKPVTVYTSKEILGLDVIKHTNQMFALITENNFFYIEEYDMGDLTKGAIKRKFLWDLGVGESDGYKEITAVKKQGTGVLAFYAHGDQLIFVKTGGGIIRVSKDMIDTRYNGGGIEFFEDARKAYERDEAAELEYRRIYNEAYILKIAEQLKSVAGSKEAPENVDSKKAEIDALASGYIAQGFDKNVSLEDLVEFDTLYKGYEISSSTVSKHKNNAKKAAENAVADLESESVTLDWCKDYDASTMKMYVKEEYIDDSCYASFIPGEAVIGGVVYAKQNNAIYYANISDGYLYTFDADKLKTAKTGSLISSLSTKIETVYCKKGQTFNTFGNGIQYNAFANTLYITFDNKRDVQIVDLNDMNNYQVVSSYKASYDMNALSGDKENKNTQVLHQVTKVDIKGTETPLLYVCSYNTKRFENKTVITALFVIFLAIALVTFCIGLWMVFSLRTEAGVKKVVFIAKDTKKNKFVYFALIFFVGMLFMFCYYEAIGAIAMAFFDYTEDRPTWLWNNFANFIKIFNSPQFWPSVGNMIFFLVADILISLIPPIIFAILLILIRSKVTSNWIRTLMFIPGIVPTMAGMMIWKKGIYSDTGILNQIIGAFGGKPIQFLLNANYVKWSLIFMGFPFVGGYLIFYGGMMNIPSEYHEAGKLEGLGTIKRFLKIDIPLIMPQIKYIFITTFIASVQNFARTEFVGSASVETPVQTLYGQLNRVKDYGMSSAYATLIFIFLFIAIATNFKMQKQDAMGADL